MTSPYQKMMLRTMTRAEHDERRARSGVRHQGPGSALRFAA